MPADPQKLHLVFFPSAVLRRRADAVTEFGEPLERLAERMFAVMEQGRGVGLAGPQVGLGLRLFVCNHTGEPADNLVVVNPEFAELTGSAEMEEGCLSIPGVTVKKRRALHARMRFLDVHGKAQERSGDDLLARIWQHEVDHLDGRLIIDNMSASDEIANRRAIKQLEEEHAAVRR